MIEVAILLAVPLAVRYAAAGHMRRLQAVAAREDEELRQLRAQFEQVTEALRQARHQLRHCEVRRQHLIADIHADRRRLDDLKGAAAGRKAA
ncbi:MAG: hypothetical protein ABIL09_15365 [Gemmatimonadota bacterium]